MSAYTRKFNKDENMGVELSRGRIVAEWISILKEGDFQFLYKQRRNNVTAKREISKIIHISRQFKRNRPLQSGSLPPKWHGGHTTTTTSSCSCSSRKRLGEEVGEIIDI